MNVEQWLNEKLGQDIWNKKYRFENETFEHWLDRVSGSNEEIKKLIREKKFLFGGRTLSNRGTGKKASYSNCYSSGYVPDSLEGIMELNKNIALTYKAQGGQGLSLSKLRPKGTPIGGQFESDGITPFMKIFNGTTEGVSQGGSRKGALLMSLACDHKEIDDFIDIKTKENSITKANLSVEIDDMFMIAVKLFYDTGEVVKLDIKKEYEGNIVEYQITPINIYKKIMKSAYDWGEPGVLLINRFRNYNLMQFVDEYEIVTGNPCGEQPLPKDGACNLGSQNLSEYVENPYTQSAYFNMDLFMRDIEIAVKGLDEVLDEGMKLHALESQRQMAYNFRNIGLGIMGLGDMFFKLGIKYGSQESKKLFDDIMYNMFVCAVWASAKLAQVKGSFPKYSEAVYDSEIIKNHFTEKERKQLKAMGLRNCSLLSIAPSGSIGTMLDVTTGIEPAFELSYKRKTESLHKEEDVYYDVYISSAKEYQDMYNTKELPDYFVTTNQIHWQDRITIQAIAQNHVDTAISSTVNLPEKTPLEDIEKLYLYAWTEGLKGVTIFREGCKRTGILTTTKDNVEKFKEEYESTWKRGEIIKAPDEAESKTYKFVSGCGNAYVTVTWDEQGKINQTFTNKGSSGTCRSNQEAVSRLISLSLRGGISMEEIIDQLQSVDICPSYTNARAKGKPVSKGVSCPHAMANILKRAIEDIKGKIQITTNVIKNEVVEDSFAKCPDCGEPLQFEGGCNQCKSCGYSKCM